MNSYSDLQDIDTDLQVQIQLQPVGTPDVTVRVAGVVDTYCQLVDTITLDYRIDLLELFSVDIELHNKTYSLEYETAVIIRLSIDNIEIIPPYDYLAEYVNDQDNKDPTSYLGFNGHWRLIFDRPFYHWLHAHSGQGWLIS